MSFGSQSFASDPFGSSGFAASASTLSSARRRVAGRAAPAGIHSVAIAGVRKWRRSGNQSASATHTLTASYVWRRVGAGQISTSATHTLLADGSARSRYVGQTDFSATHTFAADGVARTEFAGVPSLDAQHTLAASYAMRARNAGLPSFSYTSVVSLGMDGAARFRASGQVAVSALGFAAQVSAIGRVRGAGQWSFERYQVADVFAQSTSRGRAVNQPSLDFGATALSSGVSRIRGLSVATALAEHTASVASISRPRGAGSHDAGFGWTAPLFPCPRSRGFGAHQFDNVANVAAISGWRTRGVSSPVFFPTHTATAASAKRRRVASFVAAEGGFRWEPTRVFPCFATSYSEQIEAIINLPSAQTIEDADDIVSTIWT